MVDLKSIEQLLHFMKSHIHLSRYDEKFIDNISLLTQVTTNQVILFHKLVYKYRRQFVEHELFVEKLVELPWNVTVVESNQQYTDGHVNVENGKIYFKCPFNRNFIDEFRKSPLNTFVWDKDRRHYEASFSGYSLKLVLTLSKKFFNTVHVCNVVDNILHEMEYYTDVKYWEPTLVERNGNLFIVAANQALNDALSDIELNTDSATLAKLAGYGVNIDASIYEDNEKNRFICEPVTTIEQNDLDCMIDWLTEIKCDMVYLSGSSIVNAIKKQLIDGLTYADIPVRDTTIVATTHNDYNLPVIIKLKKKFESTYVPNKVSKIIYLVNSQPIEIK